MSNILRIFTALLHGKGTLPCYFGIFFTFS